MGRRRKIIIVGLPLFAQRLAKQLSEFDSESTYIHLDTYYNNWHKIKALFLIPRADLIYSINGSVTRGRVFDLALKNKVPIIMNWVGTDVLKSLEAYRSGAYDQEYISRATHYCEVNWIKRELKEMGIEAKVVNFASFDRQFELKEADADQLTVLNYIPESRQDFYGINEIIKAAEAFPNIRFLIAGSSIYERSTPENMKFLGWIDDMDGVYQNVHVCIRFTKHDGLSNFVLEALARGKQVIYNNQFDHCHFVENTTDLIDRLVALMTMFEQGKSLINKEGAEFVSREFNREKILLEVKQNIEEHLER